MVGDFIRKLAIGRLVDGLAALARPRWVAALRGTVQKKASAQGSVVTLLRSQPWQLTEAAAWSCHVAQCAAQTQATCLDHEGLDAAVHGKPRTQPIHHKEVIQM